MAAAGALFLAFIPVTSSPAAANGLFQTAIDALLAAIPGTPPVTPACTIPALSAFHIFYNFAATGAASTAGLKASREEGLDNTHARKDVNNITGLPPRLRSAHNNTMEAFPGFLVPANQTLINLLGLHDLPKSFVQHPAYIVDIAPLRSVAHFVATASVINVAWQVATGAH
ncbi:unnamed protein product [Diplocarpon coronariae]